MELKSETGYELNVAGSVTGNGSLVVNQGTVTLSAASNSVGSLEVSGGTVSTAGNDVTISDHLKVGKVTYSISGATFAARSTDLLAGADLTLGGGVLTVAGGDTLIPISLLNADFEASGNGAPPDQWTLLQGSADTAEDFQDGSGSRSLALGSNGGQVYQTSAHVIADVDVFQVDFRAAVTNGPVGPDALLEAIFYAHDGADTLTEIGTVGLDPSGSAAKVWDGGPSGDGWFGALAAVPQAADYLGQKLAISFHNGTVAGGNIWTGVDDVSLSLSVFGPVEAETTNLLVTADAEITSDVPLILGNLAITTQLAPSTTLTLSGPNFTFGDVTADDGAVIAGDPTVAGVLSAGNSAGTLTVDGNLTLATTAEYACELDGGDAGAYSNDLLSAFDQVTLAGKLSLSALQSYGTIGVKMPTIVKSTEWGADDAVTGAFDDVPPPDSHLGHGVFFRSLLPTVFNDPATNLNVEVFQAIAGDADGNQAFNFADLVQIFGASGAVYGNPAPPAPTPDWAGGDFTDDDAFTFADLVKAFGDAGAHYGAASYPAAALETPDGGAVSLIYDPLTGQLSIDAGDTELIALSIESSAGLLQITPQAEGLLDGFADVANSGQFAKLDLSGMSSLDFGQALAAMLSGGDLLADLTVTGALVGGGAIEDVSLVVTAVPEPGTVLMLLSGLTVLLLWWRRRRV